MEFKFDGTARNAQKQIKSEDYSLQFKMDSSKTFCIGMNFKSDTRDIGELDN